MKISRDFAVVMDIDGVICRSKSLIDGSDEAIKTLKMNNIEYMFMTNGGGYTEAKKAEKLTNILGYEVDPKKLILSHTPFRGLAKKFGNKRVLVVYKNYEEAKETMEVYGYKNFILIDDYLKKRPYLIPGAIGKLENLENIQKMKEIKNEEPFEAIFVLHEPKNWYLYFQLVLDILLTNGKIGNENDLDPEEHSVPLFIANPDFEYSSNYFRPRLTSGGATTCVRALYQHKTGKELNEKIITEFGKPNIETYKYVEKELKNKKRVYMIGDNILSDILGANKKGWFSILTKTGMFVDKGEETNSLLFKDNELLKPKKIVFNLQEAVEFILEKEGLK